MSGPQQLPAGDFATWLDETRNALKAGVGADVPCGECDACCRSSYFIHIEAHEVEALAHIPSDLLFDAPGLPAGNSLMGYNENGHCPMLIDDRCSIYEYRPQTCRNYDCRIFPAAGISAGKSEKKLINQQILKWKFSYTDEDHRTQSAIQATADFLQTHRSRFPDGFVPGNPNQLAILAMKVYRAMPGQSAATSNPAGPPSIPQTIAAIVENFRDFQAQCLSG